MKIITPVTVELASGNKAVYDWATEARVDRRRNLRIFQGWYQRVFHPAGEWTSYRVQAPAVTVADLASSSAVWAEEH